MKCGFCGYEFPEEEGRTSCEGCPLTRTCHRVRCPNCGFDVPVEPALIKAFKAWRRRTSGTQGKR